MATVLLAGTLTTRVGAAAETGDASIAGGDSRVRFHADRLSLDTRLETLELDGHVVVTADRYRLASDRLTLERSPRGVVVGGGGRVAFCPCPDPPVTFGFRSALVAPPTDLLLEQPTLRVGPVPVLWLPYLWLRSKERFGVLPLRVAYRGRDGPLIGSGIHVPLGQSLLDVAAAGYTKGGADTEVRLATARTTTRVRWDYLGDSLIMADLRGSLNPSEHASVAWSADTLRGDRALRGPVSLEEAALRQDRGRAIAAFSDGVTTAGLGVVADGRRGDSALGAGTLGPSSYVGASAPIGASGMAHAGASVTTLRVGAGTSLTVASARGEVRASESIDVLAIDMEARTRSFLTIGEAAVGHMASAGGSVEISLPLMKELGDRARPMQHWITPFVIATGGAVDQSGPSVVDAPLPSGGFYIASAGVRTTLGDTAGDRSAITSSVAPGVVGGADRPRPVLSASASGRAGIFGTRADVVSLVQERSRPSLGIVHARIGPDDGPFLSARTMFESSAVPVSTRLVSASAWDAPWVPWLDRAGWTLGASLGVPWTRWLGTRADVDYDATHRELLGIRGGVSYLHPCRCLAVAVWSGTRLGRRTQGIPDSWLTVDLMP